MNVFSIVLLGTEGATLNNINTWAKFNFIGEISLKMKDALSLSLIFLGVTNIHALVKNVSLSIH